MATIEKKPDGSIDLEASDRGEVVKLFERELDELHTRGQRMFSEGQSTHLTSAERARIDREDEQWREGLRRRVRDALRNHDISVSRVTRALDYSEFYVSAHDATATHRDYSVTITPGEALDVARMHDRDPFAAVASSVVEKILEARARYHARLEENR